MRVLVACEFSGVVRDAFLRRGHDAWSCDLLPTESPGPHIQGDVLEVLGDGWDLMIGHPDCTYLCNSGVRWLHTEPGRWERMQSAADFFWKLRNAPIKRICLENPRPHRYGIGKTYTQKIQPYQFGHMETKETCLWLKSLPPLEPTNDVQREMMQLPKNKRSRVHYASPGKDRWKERARFFPGIADAMADQWGVLQPNMTVR